MEQRLPASKGAVGAEVETGIQTYDHRWYTGPDFYPATQLLDKSELSLSRGPFDRARHQQVSTALTGLGACLCRDAREQEGPNWYSDHRLGHACAGTPGSRRDPTGIAITGFGGLLPPPNPPGPLALLSE